ncbi:MAG: phage holin family protein [Oscillospiraceae bacterium]|nr:phage holin family protein [Oscillospiraceae bacterium]MDE6777630.1 phage holin family protein [Oscillospiraceae bacterium]
MTTDFLKWMTSVLCGIAGFLWGNLDGLLLALIAFMVLDYITGVIVGKIANELSSKTGFIGIAKKGFMLAVVAVGHILDTQVFGGDGSVCRSAVIGFYLANEGLSILENAGKLGIPLPDFLKKTLKQLKNESSKK